MPCSVRPVALILCAVAPTFPLLLAALALVGLTTVSGQILVPLAGDLADDATRGRVVGTVVSGILIGILASRTVSGLITARRAGRLHDRGPGLPGIGIAWALVLVAFVVAALGSTSVAVIIAAILILDIAIQGHNIMLQSRMFQADPDARSRINTAFVTNNFIGAMGSGLAGFLWSHGGWTAVTVAGMAMGTFAFSVWLIGRRGPLVAPGNPAESAESAEKSN